MKTKIFENQKSLTLRTNYYPEWQKRARKQ